MPYVVNGEKERARGSALRQAEQAEQAVSGLVGGVNSLISQLDYAIGGAASGIDQGMTGQCRSALGAIHSAQSQLRDAIYVLKRVNTKEWVSDEEQRR